MSNEKYLFGNICGNSDIIVDQLIENGQKFDLILTDLPSHGRMEKWTRLNL